MNTVKVIDLDVPQKKITIGITNQGCQNKSWVYGVIANDLDAVDKLC